MIVLWGEAERGGDIGKRSRSPELANCELSERRRFVTQASLVNRRTFVKGMLAAGATVTVAACAPLAAPSGPAPAAPVAPPTVTGPSWIHPKSLVRAAPGYGGAHLTWKYGDTVKWLPPEKYQADAAADALAKLPKEKLTDIYSKMLR